jgi:hypothetical protein
MGKAKKVLTPGSYKGVGKGKKRVASSKKKKPGRPVTTGVPKTKKKAEKRPKYRSTYTEEDMLEAIRLVREEDFSCARACEVINDKKTNIVPRMSLNDRLRKDLPTKPIPMGRPQVRYCANCAYTIGMNFDIVSETRHTTVGTLHTHSLDTVWYLPYLPICWYYFIGAE